MSVIILLIIGLTLIFINIKVIKKDDKNLFEEKLNSIDDDDSKDYNFEIGKLRKEFGETIFELQQEIEELKKEVVEVKKMSTETNEKTFCDDNVDKRDLEKKIDVVVDNDIEYECEDKVEDDEKNLKVKEIRNMMKDGLSTDEISQKLNIGKGEVLLIQKLYIE